MYNVVRPLPLRNAISIDGVFPIEPQYIFSSAAHIQKNGEKVLLYSSSERDQSNKLFSFKHA